MAFALASKGAPLAGLLKNLLRTARSTSGLQPASSTTARRLFGTKLGDRVVLDDDDYYVESIDGELVFYPKLHASSASSSTRCGWWVSNQDEDSLQLKVQMPGLAAEHVKVRTDPKGLFIKGKGVKDPDDVPEYQPCRYSCRINFSMDAFAVHQARAEMKDGVLKVTMPRVKVDRGESIEIKVRKFE